MDRHYLGDRFSVTENANRIAAFDGVEIVLGVIAQLGECGFLHDASCTVMYIIMYIHQALSIGERQTGYCLLLCTWNGNRDRPVLAQTV